MTRRERMERRVAQRTAWAAKAAARSQERIGAADALGAQIPLGQPILVGHHSERRARRDAERIRGNLERGFAEADKAQHHAQAAETLERRLDENIFSDDPDAIAALEARIAEREAAADRVAVQARAWRRAKGTVAERVAALVADGTITEAEGRSVASALRLCTWLERQPFNATSLRAAIRADRERIERIRREAARTAQAEAAGGVAITGAPESEYVHVHFAEKPERAVLDALKAAGFWWAAGGWNGKREALPEGLRPEPARPVLPEASDNG